MPRPKAFKTRGVASREEIIAQLQTAHNRAVLDGNHTAALAALDKLAKAEAMYRSDAGAETREVELTPEQFVAEMRDLISDDVIREYLRAAILEYDDARGGPPMGLRSL